ncbi:MAG: hypothetical protein VZS44_02740 [Bacilli bacterium]|nr:hypothetical protein [Bacilli bacterium]
MFKKIIIINDDKDLNIFYNKLIIYRSIFYINTKFYSNDKRIEDIVEALNIKSWTRRIDYVYDKACFYVDEYWKDKNICGFKNNKCYTQQEPNCSYRNGCCRRCYYQSNKGCVTSNLTCKLYYCTEVTKRYKVILFDDIKILNLFNFRQRTILKHDYFSSREEVLMDLYISSMIIFAVRILWRFFRKNIV